MKILRKTLAILLALCLLTAAVPMMALTANAEGGEYRTYELYEYMSKVKALCDSGTPIVNDTPWSLQVRGFAEGADGVYPAAWHSPFGATTRDGDYIYYYNSANAWGMYPGFAFYYPANYNGADRLYINIATPTNSDGSSLWRTNVAYAFTAPEDGVYQVQKADQNLVQSFDWGNNFAPHDDGGLDFGVRITVDDVTVWPDSEQSYYSDGWAVFGSGALSTVSKIDIPTVQNLAMREGQVLRVEFTNFTPTGAPWCQRIRGSFAVKHTGDYPSEKVVPEQSELPIRYEAYDYLTAQALNTGVVSPWNVQLNQNNGGWNAVDTQARDGDYSYLHWSPYEWGGNWPGVNSYQPANYAALDRYYLSFITATNCWGNVTDAAYCFTAPFTGNYTIGKADQNKVISFDETNYFKFRRSSAPANQKCGVRITVDGKTVWPSADDTFYDSGYACFGPGADLPDMIEVPTLDLFLNEDSVVRVEFKEFVVSEEWPWELELCGLVSATLNDIEGTAVPVSREIETLGLYDAAEDVEVTGSYLLDAGASVANANTNTLANDGVHLSFLAFSQGLRLALNGFDFILDGDDTAIAAGDDVRSITVAENEDGLYNVTYNVSPAFGGNEVIGSYVSLTVNGVSYNEYFEGVIPAPAKNGALVIENIGDDELTVMPGDLQVRADSGMSVVGTVLYVGENDDFAAVKAGIVAAGSYQFLGDTVATGSFFMREGRDDVFYNLARKGDVNCDGAASITDLVRLKKAAAGTVTLSDAQAVAAGFGSADVSAADALVGLRAYLLG